MRPPETESETARHRSVSTERPRVSIVTPVYNGAKTLEQTIESVAELSLIQGVIPDHILGRVNATLEVFSHGMAYPLGALLAAALAGWIGVRGGIAVGWTGMAFSILLLVLSPLPRVRQPSDAATVDG